MATCKELTSDLTCTICADYFEKPTTLPCGHTLCFGCLVAFAESHRETRKKRAIPCPYCLQWHEVPGGSTVNSIETWVSRFKTSISLQRLVETVQKSQDDSCFCVVQHSDVRSIGKSAGKPEGKCSEHPNYDLELFCDDCNKPICAMCGALTHKMCANLVLLTPLMKATVEADVRRLKTSNAILKTKLNSSKVALNEFITHCEVVAGEVKSTAQEIQNKVKEWEEKNLKYLMSFRNEKVSEMEKRIADGTAALNKTKKTIEIASKCDGSVESFVSVKVDISTAQHALDKCSKSAYNTPGNGWHINIIDNSMLRLPQDLKIPKVVENSNVLKNTHKVSKMKSKLGFHDVVDVTVVTINDVEIAVCTVYHADVNLLAFPIKSSKSSAYLKIPTAQHPWAVAKFPPGRVIANCSHTTELSIVEIKEDLSKYNISLSISKTLRTLKRYESLAALSTDTFAAGTDAPPSIDILHMSGIILKSFDNHTLGRGMLSCPSFMCVDHDLNLLVSDCGTKTVSCISLDGSVLFRYPQRGTKGPVLECPHGVTVDKDGSIFVVDHRRHVVVQLTKTGYFVRKVVGPEHLKNPHGVAFDSNGNMVVSHPGAVFVFKFQ